MFDRINMTDSPYRPPDVDSFFEFIKVQGSSASQKYFYNFPYQERSIRTCAAILAAASDTARQCGAESLTMSVISQVSGVSLPGIYRYFSSLQNIIGCAYDGLHYHLWSKRIAFVRGYSNVSLREACTIYCYAFVSQTCDAIADYMKTHLYGQRVDLFMPGHEHLARYLREIALRQGIGVRGGASTFTVPSIALGIQFREQWEKERDFGQVRANWRFMAQYYEHMQHVVLAEDGGDIGETAGGAGIAGVEIAGIQRQSLASVVAPFGSGAIEASPLKVRFALLTERESAVMRLVFEGHSNKRIAQTMDVSVRTIEFHRMQMMRKLQVDNVAQLIKLAIRAGVYE